jgi:AbrB family looped-hinge helix DNA binding protein
MISYPVLPTVVSTKGQIVLPAEIRRQDGIEAGQEFEVQRIDRGEYRLVRRSPRMQEGMVDWLLACPEKEFFAPIESDFKKAGVRILNPFA